MRLQLALNVPDLEAAIDFYGRLFGVEVAKRKPGYANFEVDQPALKLVLFESDGTDRLNHLGVEVFEGEAVAAAAEQIQAAGLTLERDEEEQCCFARQNKAITYAPDGTMWEWYRKLDDLAGFADDEAPTTATSCC